MIARQELCEIASGSDLRYLRGEAVPPAEAQGNIENLVGFAQVPTGIAGPLMVRGRQGTYEVYVPMATNEGAMVASYSRGMGLLAAGGGARVRVTDAGLSQHPMLVFTNMAAAESAAARAVEDAPHYQELVRGMTQHGGLRQVLPEVLGRRLLLRLVFDTGDAIGVNMAARAADQISRELAERTHASEVHVHGQDVEKRANSRALVEGRGRSVQAEVVIPQTTLIERTRTRPEEMVRIARTYAVGYAQLGTQNWLVQAANGLAAVMLACGQDLGYLAEAATGYLDLDLTKEGDLYASVVLPSLLVGTVGGGALKGTARECLDLLGCAGSGGVGRFAEILGATVLAGDVSLMAAFCAQEFVAAHEQLGRNRPAE